jgi:polyisoprenoid-binding protein YceI
MTRTSWLLLCFALLPVQSAELHRLDGGNTRISFNIQHFGVLWVGARFPDFSGAFVLDPRGVSSRVDVSVQMATVECTDSLWNTRLRSAEWLDVQRYPQMTFHSTRVDFVGDGAALASGELTLHGITQTGRRCTQQRFSQRRRARAGTLRIRARNNEHLTRFQCDYLFAHLNVYATLEHQKEIVRVIVLMPNKFALNLDHHQIVAIELTNHAGLPVLRER